jgi:hypothetical protein
MADDAATTEDGSGGGSHLLRWLVLIALAIGAVVAGRRVALDRADREFEERLRGLDDRRE